MDYNRMMSMSMFLEKRIKPEKNTHTKTFSFHMDS